MTDILCQCLSWSDMFYRTVWPIFACVSEGKNQGLVELKGKMDGINCVCFAHISLIPLQFHISLVISLMRICNSIQIIFIDFSFLWFFYNLRGPTDLEWLWISFSIRRFVSPSPLPFVYHKNGRYMKFWNLWKLHSWNLNKFFHKVFATVVSLSLFQWHCALCIVVTSRARASRVTEVSRGGKRAYSYEFLRATAWRFKKKDIYHFFKTIIYQSSIFTSSNFVYQLLINFPFQTCQFLIKFLAIS